MQTFATASDAKEFLVSGIVRESQRQGVPLSEVERKMLYFSETDSTLPDIVEVNDVFNREYDQAEYERKIGKLACDICANARAHSRDELDAWREAVRLLSQEDHYLLVLIDEAGAPGLFMRFLKLLAIALVISCVIIAIGFLIMDR